MGRPHIVHIVLDAFRLDHLHRAAADGPLRGFLEDFCRTATEFGNAISPAPHTCPMHASLFTGPLPNEHGVYLPGDVVGRALPLPDLPGDLGQAGYLTISLSDNAFFDPGSAFGRGFDMHTHTPHLSGHVERSGLSHYWCRLLAHLPPSLRPGRDTSGTPGGTIYHEQRVSRHEQLVRGLNTSLGMIRNLEPDRPVYMYVNLMPTHGAYLFEPEDADATRPAGLTGPRLLPRNYLPRLVLDFLGVRPMDELTLAELHWAYAASARYVSRLAKRLVSVIDRHLDPGNTDIAILSDHGELLGEYGWWEHGTFLYEELVHVPLVVRSPALPAVRRSESLVQTHWLWQMARQRAGLADPGELPTGQGSLTEAADGPGAEVAWSLSDATAGMSLMQRAMGVVMRHGLGAERVRPKPLDPHLQAVRTGDAALLVTKSGRRLAFSRGAKGEERELASPEAEAVIADLSPHLLEMPDRQRSAGGEGFAGLPDPEVMERLRNLGYAD